jgi:hypothetical protein
MFHRLNNADDKVRTAELSSRTFWAWWREFSLVQGVQAASLDSQSDPETLGRWERICPSATAVGAARTRARRLVGSRSIAGAMRH